MLIIGICDDDNLIFDRVRKELHEYLNEIGEEYEFYTFQTATELLEYCQSAVKQLDLLFMDIELPEMSGIDLCNKVHEYQPQCQIAYHTNYIVYASEVYETKHCYYILKEQFAQRLPYVIGKVKEQKRNKEIFIYVHAGMERIYTEQILYIEREVKKTYIYMEDGSKIETRYKLADLMELLDPITFVRCHASFIVPFPKVKKYARVELILENDKRIPISRNYAGAVKETFGKWSGTQI